MDPIKNNGKISFQESDFQIDIFEDHSYIGGSVDNINAYNFEYFTNSPYNRPSIIGIQVSEYGNFIKSAVIAAEGGATGVYEDNIILKDNKLLICCSDSVFCLSVPGLGLLWCTKADNVTCFCIYSYMEDFIVHGELCISRINKDGNIIWQRGGSDIFVNINGHQEFEMKENYIQLIDFEDRIYKIGYDGNWV